MLNEFEQKHITGTMRKKEGDIIGIIDGSGGFFESRISQIKPSLKLDIIRHEQKPKPAVNLALAMAFIKPARLEFILEKGTELGVTQFFIYRSRFTIYMSENQDRYLKKIRQALKQSRQYYLPHLSICSSLPELIDKIKVFNSRFLAVDATYISLFNKLISNQTSKSSGDAVLVIGPEGGFETDEISNFSAAGFNFVSLGPSRLRAETAAISGFSIMKSYYDHLTEGAV